MVRDIVTIIHKEADNALISFILCCGFDLADYPSLVSGLCSSTAK